LAWCLKHRRSVLPFQQEGVFFLETQCNNENSKLNKTKRHR